MKFGIDPPGYRKCPVERMAFNLYAIHEQKIQDIINYINEYDEDSLSAACAAIGANTFDLTDDDIRVIAESTGRIANYGLD